ncbi:hypothetical protein NST44_00160 [Paenibacillus sp. FSL W8-0919]|uniref:hypothetical protein n=1 Tax=Paenibacillus sp. FSL W8-0919 TaxID=2954707 RepID=UPI0030F61D2E
MIKIKVWRYVTIIGCLVLLLSACNSQRGAKAVDLDSSYQEWKKEVTNALDNRDYVFPAYDEKAGPLEFIYDPSLPDFWFELYRSNDYRISKELSGVHTVHDRYFHYSLIEEVPDKSEILSPYSSDTQIERVPINNELAIINNNISEYQSGNIIVYEISEDPKNTYKPKKVVEYLGKRSIKSGLVLLVNMEGRINVEVYLPVNEQAARLIFTVEDLGELETFIGMPVK